MRYARGIASVCTNLDSLSYNLYFQNKQDIWSAYKSPNLEGYRPYLRTSVVSRKHDNVVLRHRILKKTVVCDFKGERIQSRKK